MSGIYIKGMEMPKRCNVCRFLEGDSMDGVCHAADKWMDDEDWTWYVYEEGDIDTDKPANCPLIAVPDHGRLIDADEFYADINESVLLTDGFKEAFNLWFDEQPTIIPAEESKDAD